MRHHFEWPENVNRKEHERGILMRKPRPLSLKTTMVSVKTQDDKSKEGCVNLIFFVPPVLS